ncbi:unnamed protein product [Allacma fusca]|uniref:Uncharacterized protein n=1 Tax=Allacma fusca TaxID=39272 RepID=A0A8J2NVA7_9HEXA|nr:unnamed protein product [Allacma fusca]
MPSWRQELLFIKPWRNYCWELGHETTASSYIHKKDNIVKVKRNFETCIGGASSSQAVIGLHVGFQVGSRHRVEEHF